MRDATGSLMLEANEISKSFEGTRVVDRVSLDVPSGEVKVIIGPSGSGKSTLLRCLALLEEADAGEIWLDGKRVGGREGSPLFGVRERRLARDRADIGMVFQRFNLFPHLRAVDNVSVGLTTVRKLSRADARERAEAMLERVGLAERAHAYPSELSGGQQQRVAIARALVMEPKVMLFDEPTSALDAELVGEVLRVMEDLARAGTTMVVVTHELGFARRVATHVAMMDAGVLVEEADPVAFFESPEHERTRRFLDHMR
jgi:ABC-type polar amino acid transport system ATPase subunit